MNYGYGDAIHFSDVHYVTFKMGLGRGSKNWTDRRALASLLQIASYIYLRVWEWGKFFMPLFRFLQTSFQILYGRRAFKSGTIVSVLSINVAITGPYIRRIDLKSCKA